MKNNHQPTVEEPGAKYLLYIFFIMCFYTVHNRCNKEVSDWNNKMSFELTTE